MKKLLLFLLAMCALQATWAYDFSAVAPTGQTLYYNIISGTTNVEVTYPGTTTYGYYSGYPAPTGDLEIPSTVTNPNNGNTYSVTSIGHAAFYGCPSLTSVTIGNSVTSIENAAFSGCSSLTSVTIPNSVTSIGYYAFSGCSSLTSVTIPNSVTSIENAAFSGCSSLTSVTIPNSVTSIGNDAFAICRSLTSITIPNSVTSIGDYAFYSCSSLTSITIPNSVTSIGNEAFSNCSSITNVNYTGTIAEWCGISFGNPFANPTYYAHTLSFNGTPMGTTLTIPNSVTSIGNLAFANCSDLTSVTIPNSVTSIGNQAFYCCRSLTSVTIPNSVTSIGNAAFCGCSSLTSVTIPNSVTSIGINAFLGCGSLTSVTIPNSVTSIGNQAFAGVKNIVYSGSATGLPWGALCVNGYIEGNLIFTNSSKTILAGCDIAATSVTIPNSVTSIGNHAFSGCNFLTSVTIPNSVTSIGDYAFYNCSSLTSVTIGNSVTSIGDYAFSGCSSLTSVTIGNSVTSIGANAFSYCSITSVTIPNSVTSIGYFAFLGVGTILYCGSATGAPWGAVKAGCFDVDGDFLYSDNTHTVLAGYIGEGGNVTIPNSVTSIGDNAFVKCKSLTSVTIGNSVTSIAGNAFSGCTNLKTIYNLSELNIETNSYGFSVNRVVIPAQYGTGDNAIYKIPTTYSFVDEEDNVETNIPRSTIPATNFIYNDNGWKAKEIILTDGQDKFLAPETFTAASASYTRDFTNTNRSTLCLPFTAAIPEDFEVYDFTNFANNTISFTKREDSIYAYTPYLVGYNLSKDGNTTMCTFTQENVVFPKTSTATPACTTTYNGMTFKGTMERKCMNSTNYGYKDGFFVQSANGTSDDHGSHAHVNPFRAYFTYSPSSDAPQSLPPTLNVEVSYGDPVGIDAVEAPEQEYDGRYGNDVYDMLGRLVRKNADNLEGLPRGIYIWKGKKHFNN